MYEREEACIREGSARERERERGGGQFKRERLGSGNHNISSVKTNCHG